jgi:hypothetical protein
MNENLSYLTTEYAREKMIEEYNKPYPVKEVIMGFNNEEKEWLDKYEARLIERGLAKHEAIDIRNAVVDIELNADPADCADDELSYGEN